MRNRNLKDSNLRQSLSRYQSQLMVHLNTRLTPQIDHDLVSFWESRIKAIKLELSGSKDSGIKIAS